MEVKQKNYLVIQGWMRTELDLSGSELLLYAIIYGFSQEENQWCTCGLQYFCNWLGINDKSNLRRVVNRLIEKGLIIKDESIINGVKFCKYQAVVKKTISEIPPRSQNDHTPTVKMTTNNYNIDTNNTPVLSNDNTSPKGTRPRFSPPSVEDVKAYCLEKGYSVDAQHFVDFYESKGWVVGKSPMKDWHAAIRTWIRNEKIYQPTTTTQYVRSTNSKFTSPEDARAAIIAGVNAGLTELYQSARQ